MKNKTASTIPAIIITSPISSLKIKDETNHSTIPVTDTGLYNGKLLGLITSKDYRVSRLSPDTKVKDLMTKFGGHPMAAGLTLPKDNLDVFRYKLNELTTLKDSDLVAKISIDVPMPISYITENRS